MPRHSYSALQVLAQCERKYTLRFFEELEADRQDRPAPLRGTAWHAVMQAALLEWGAHRKTLLVQPTHIQVLKGFDLAISWDTPYAPTVIGPDYGPEMPLSPTTIIAHIRSWWNQQETSYREEMEAEFGAPLADRLLDLWNRYTLHYGADDQRYQTLITEYEWERQTPKGKLLQGRVDAVLYDTQLGLVVVRDYKTHESWPSEADHVLDLMDSQLHLQAWGVAPVLKEHGLIPQAVEFDRLRFKKPSTPKLTTKGVLSKSTTDYDGYTYRAWTQTAEAKEAGYEFDQAAFDKAEENRDAWFRRSMKPLSMRAVEAHVRAAEAQIIRSESLDTKTSALVPSKACGWCDFLSLCRAEIIGGRPEHIVLSEFGLRKQR